MGVLTSSLSSGLLKQQAETWNVFFFVWIDAIKLVFSSLNYPLTLTGSNLSDLTWVISLWFTPYRLNLIQWTGTLNVLSLSCQDDHTKGCKCPPGFKGDGVNLCEGIVNLLLYIISFFEICWCFYHYYNSQFSAIIIFFYSHLLEDSDLCCLCLQQEIFRALLLCRNVILFSVSLS